MTQESPSQEEKFMAINPKDAPSTNGYKPLPMALEDFVRMKDSERILLQSTQISGPRLEDDHIIIEEKLDKVEGVSYGNLVIITYPDKGKPKLTEYADVRGYCAGKEYRDDVNRTETRKIMVKSTIYQNAVMNKEAIEKQKQQDQKKEGKR